MLDFSRGTDAMERRLMHGLLVYLTRTTLLASACVCLFVSTAQRANAVDANPRDYVPTPVGTHSALFYYY